MVRNVIAFVCFLLLCNAGMVGDAWPDLMAEFQKHYATLEKYR